MNLGEWLMRFFGRDHADLTENVSTERERAREEALLREWRRRADATRLRASLQRDRE